MADDATPSERPEEAVPLRSLIEALPNVAWVTEGDRGVVVNERWYAYTGTDLGVRESIHPDDLHLAGDLWAHRAEGKPYGYEVRIRRADGAWRWNRIRVVPFRRHLSEPPSWIGTVADFHEERIKERSLRMLMAVNAETRGLSDPIAIVATALRALGLSLEEVGCSYGEIDEAEEAVSVLQTWPSQPDVLESSYRLADFGDPQRAKGGQTLAIGDVRSAYSPEVAARFEGMGVRSLISVPLVKEGRLAALLSVTSRTPREWGPSEAESVRLVADSVWSEIERARAERTAAERASGLRALVEANPIGVCVVDMQSGRVTDANEAWLRALGRTREELDTLGIDWREITAPNSIAVSEARLAEAREKGSTGLYEKEYLRADGTAIPVLVGFTPLDKDLHRVTAFMLDLSELRHAERAVVEGERRYRILAETIPAIAFTLLPDGEVEYVNSRGEEYFGVGLAQGALEGLGQLIAQGESFEVERPLLGAGRQYRWHLCRAVPMHDADGGIVRWIGTFTDVHEAKSRERLLRFLVDLDDATANLEDPAQAIRETAYMLAGAVGADRCVYTETRGDGFAILGDYARNGGSTVGESLAGGIRVDETTLIEDVDALGLASDVREAYAVMAIAALITAPVVRGGEIVAGMSVHQSRPRRWTREEINLVRQAAERSWINIERVRSRQALRESEERLREANESLEIKVAERTADLQAANDALQGFTYHVSHDLRTPLRSIVSTSRIVQADYGDSMPPEALDLLDRQAVAARKLGQLIDDLLRLSRLSSGELTKTKIDLSAMGLDAATEALSAHPGSTVKIVVDEGLTTQADPRLLRLAVVNLLENAVKYSPDGGTVRMSANEGGFKVADEGIGMEPQYLERIFEPFQRLHRDDAYKGTGIGLANVRRVIERHGGQVWAESELGQGATFFVAL